MALGKLVDDTTCFTAFDGGKSVDSGKYLPMIEGKVDLSLIDMQGEILVNDNLQIEFVMKTKDGQLIPIGSGVSQAFLAKGIFFKVSCQRAADERKAKVFFLKQIQLFMEQNPEGGLCETSAGTVFLRLLKKKVKETDFKSDCEF